VWCFVLCAPVVGGGGFGRCRSRSRGRSGSGSSYTRGIDEDTLLEPLPRSLRRDIKRHVCLDLVKKVRPSTETVKISRYDFTLIRRIVRHVCLDLVKKVRFGTDTG